MSKADEMYKKMDIKEAISIIKNIIYLPESKEKMNYIDLSNSCGNECEEFVTAIETVLSDYQRQLEINEEHKKLNGELREEIIQLKEENKKQWKIGYEEARGYYEKYNYKLKCELKANSISKDVIKEVIQKIEQEEFIIQKAFDNLWKIESKTNFEKQRLAEYSSMQQEVSAIKGWLEELLQEKR